MGQAPPSTNGVRPLPQTTRASTNKRGYIDDPDDEINKRVKASHAPPTSVTPSTHFLDIRPSTSVSARSVSNDVLDHNPTNDLQPRIPATISPPAFKGVKSDAVVPAVPLDAIATMQQASGDMLKALVKRDAADREKQLLIAVGTMRTCLDIHFVPYMEIWREAAKAASENTLNTSTAMDDEVKGSPITSGRPPGTL
jgi:hypothetical protein